MYSNGLFTPPTRTRQDSFVLSASAVWTSRKLCNCAAYAASLRQVIVVTRPRSFCLILLTLRLSKQQRINVGVDAWEFFRPSIIMNTSSAEWGTHLSEVVAISGGGRCPRDRACRVRRMLTSLWLNRDITDMELLSCLPGSRGATVHCAADSLPFKGRGVNCHPGLTYIFNFWHSDTLALRLWRSALSARVSECQKLKI